MKILVYGINYAPELTGVGKYTAEMCEWLSDQGHDVRVVTGIPFYPQWQILDGYSNFWKICHNNSGVKVWRCPIYVPRAPGGLKRILHLVSFAISSFPIILIQSFWKPSIVFVLEPAFVCVPSALLISKLSRAKSWIHIQDFEIDAAFSLGLLSSISARRVLLSIESSLLKNFDKASTISSNMLKLLCKKGVQVNRSFLFPNWVDTSKIYPLGFADGHRITDNQFRIKLGITDDICVILYSGNMGEKQGLEVIIELAQKLANRPDICFVMCGQGVAYPRLRALSLGFSNIKWLPLQPLDKLNELLNMADIHFLPQLASAADLVMPSKLAGIFASGQPVVAIADPSSSLFKIIEGNGVAIPPDNIFSLVRAITDLADNQSLRIFFGKQARNFAVVNFDKNKILENFELTLMACMSS